MGFGLASVAVMGNDALQTLGPFLASQRGRGGRWRQGLALAALLCVVLLLSWGAGGGDPAWGRLDRFPLPDPFRPRDLLPLGALLLLTRLGLPVSTSFLVLTALAPARLGAMVGKSLAGYGVAFAVAAAVYGLWSPWLEGRPGEEPAAAESAEGEEARAAALVRADGWNRLQWLATLVLWSQWLVQDLANIYVYLPRRL
ncbi:MAG: hypothetical protein FJ083_08285, partial [Cyanobacteria bacterium K_Offshore_surface_m2_239]|nr:hypothetical protein [Cyanobacteria bacterium K_Offshore_surface_m2_239]